VLAPHPAVATGEGESGDARFRNQPQRDGKAVLLGGPIDVTDQRAACGVHPAGGAVNGNVAELAQVDHQSGVDHGGAGYVVPATAHRDP
jgi:hypothetical protein